MGEIFKGTRWGLACLQCRTQYWLPGCPFCGPHDGYHGHTNRLSLDPDVRLAWLPPQSGLAVEAACGRAAAFRAGLIAIASGE